MQKENQRIGPKGQDMNQHRIPNQLHASLYMKGNDMQEYKKTVVVTRDDNGNVCVWNKNASLKYGDGTWESNNNYKYIIHDEMMTPIEFNFKEQYGFTPRKGSRETIEIIVRRLK